MDGADQSLVMNILKALFEIDGLEEAFDRAHRHSKETGILLAEAIQQAFPHHAVSVLGHSLGGQVTASCMMEFNRDQVYQIHQTFTMGGVPEIPRSHLYEEEKLHEAVKADWENIISQAISYKYTNLWDSSDYVLTIF